MKIELSNKKLETRAEYTKRKQVEFIIEWHKMAEYEIEYIKEEDCFQMEDMQDPSERGNVYRHSFESLKKDTIEWLEEQQKSHGEPTWWKELRLLKEGKVL